MEPSAETGRAPGAPASSPQRHPSRLTGHPARGRPVLSRSPRTATFVSTAPPLGWSARIQTPPSGPAPIHAAPARAGNCVGDAIGPFAGEPLAGTLGGGLSSPPGVALARGTGADRVAVDVTGDAIGPAGCGALLAAVVQPPTSKPRTSTSPRCAGKARTG